MTFHIKYFLSSSYLFILMQFYIHYLNTIHKLHFSIEFEFVYFNKISN